MIECIVEMLKEDDPAPKVVQELIRCRDCIRRGTYDCPVHVGCGVDGYDEPDDWFCADGERKE